MSEAAGAPKQTSNKHQTNYRYALGFGRIGEQAQRADVMPALTTTTDGSSPLWLHSVLMHNAAREAVKYNIRAEGLRFTDLMPKDISRMAEVIIDNHRDKVLAGALRAIERSPELQRLPEKEQREWAKRIARNSSPKVPANQAVSVNETHAQNDGSPHDM
jgi:hypothetical protein